MMIQKINKLLLFLSGIGLITLMLLITIGVITRYVFGYSIPTAYAITENYLMPLTVFAAVGYVYQTGIFPKVDVFIEKIHNQRTKQIVNIVIHVVELILFIFITYFFYQYTVYSVTYNLAFSANSIDFPLSPGYILITLAFLWLSIMIVVRIINTIKGKEKEPFSGNVE